MILRVPTAYAPKPGGASPMRTPDEAGFLFDTVLKSDFLFRAAARIARSTLRREILAIPPEVVKNASADEQARIGKVLERILRSIVATANALRRHIGHFQNGETNEQTFELFTSADGYCRASRRRRFERFVALPNGDHISPAGQRFPLSISHV